MPFVDPPTPRLRLARTWFPFLICTAFSSILIGPGPVAKLYQTDPLQSAGFFGPPFLLIILTSIGRITAPKRRLFYLGLLLLFGWVLLLNAGGNFVTWLSTIPFLISSTVTVVIRQLEAPDPPM
jgi:hypothetical protein